MDPRNEEIPVGVVNFASRFINLSNVMGEGDWERKNWAEECSSIIDTGFNGGGLRIFFLAEEVCGILVKFLS